MQFKRTPNSGGSSPVPLPLNQLLEQAKQTIERQASEIQELKQENQVLKQENQVLKQENQQLISTNSKLNSKIQEKDQLIQEQHLRLIEYGQLIEEMKPRATNVAYMEEQLQKETSARKKSEKRASLAEASADEMKRIVDQNKVKIEKEMDWAVTSRLKAEEDSKKAKHLQKLCAVGLIAPDSLFIIFVIQQLHRNQNILLEMGQWFVNRWGNILWIMAKLKSFFLILKNGLMQHMNDKAAVLLTVCIFLLILGTLLFLAFIGIKKGIDGLKTLFYCYDENGVLKAILSVTFSLVTLLICVYLPETVRARLSVNIFTVWLVLSLITVVLVNLKEIIIALKDERRYY